MLRFIDGPAAGVVLQCQRAPIFLRVVCRSAEFGNLEWDALDQVDDVPDEGETIHVYIRLGGSGWVHYDGRDAKGKRFGRTIATGDYTHVKPAPAESILRDNIAWQEWAKERWQSMRYDEKTKKGTQQT